MFSNIKPLHPFTIPRNTQAVIFNKFQGQALKVLTVCSAGCLRSPSAATLLSCEPFNFNTRSCGLDSFAIVQISPNLLAWADIILVMEPWMKKEVEQLVVTLEDNNHFGFNEKNRNVISLDIPDNFEYMQPELQVLMLEKFNTLFNMKENNEQH